MITLGRQFFRELLMRTPGEHKVHLVYESDVKLKAKDVNGVPCPLKDVVKIAIYSGTIGKKHRDAENEAIKAKGSDYELPVQQARKWGTRIEGTPLIEHKGKHYLEATEVEEELVQYQFGEMFLTESVVKPWLYDKQEIVSKRDFDLDKIKRCKIADQDIEVT